MYTEGIFKLLVQVVSSWQVIAATVALVIYLHMVFYVAKAYHRPMVSKIKFKKKKSKSEDTLAAPPKEAAGEEASINDELGLEEE